MAVCRLSEERTLAHQQARRRSQTVSGPRGNAISISGSSRVLRRGLGERHVLGSRGSTRRLRTGLLLGVCSWWRCSRDSCIPRRQNTQEIIRHIYSSAFFKLRLPLLKPPQCRSRTPPLAPGRHFRRPAHRRCDWWRASPADRQG